MQVISIYVCDGIKPSQVYTYAGRYPIWFLILKWWMDQSSYTNQEHGSLSLYTQGFQGADQINSLHHATPRYSS